MSTKRRTINRTGKRHLTPEIIAAWQAADFRALHCALKLAPWQPSPLPSEITSLGCSQDEEPSPHSERLWDKDLRRAQALQRQLLAIAGWPDCRTQYQKNLREAQEMTAYYAMLLKHPERRHQGTGSDEASLRRKLQDERAKVRYRRRLLRELEAVQEEYRAR